MREDYFDEENPPSWGVCMYSYIWREGGREAEMAGNQLKRV